MVTLAEAAADCNDLTEGIDSPAKAVVAIAVLALIGFIAWLILR